MDSEMYFLSFGHYASSALCIMSVGWCGILYVLVLSLSCPFYAIPIDPF